MGYYDSIKDNVKDDGEEGNPSFDTLKEKAEKTSENDEEKGDDTPIEVLEDGGLSREKPKRNENNQTATQTGKKEDNSSNHSRREEQSSGSSDNSFKQAAQNSSSPSGSGKGSMDAVEQKLERIIEQNERMIEILESFGS